MRYPNESPNTNPNRQSVPLQAADTIAYALQQLEQSYQTGSESETVENCSGWFDLPLSTGMSGIDGLPSPTRRFVVQYADLIKMQSMGLEQLPIDSIAIPEDSPLFGNRHTDITNTYDLSGQLTRFFPTHFVAALYELQQLLEKAGLKAFVIGGISRDLLLFQQKRFELTDVDITLEGDALAFSKLIAQNSRNFQVIDEFPEFGTVKLCYKNTLMMDLASTRQEVYTHAGALPQVIKRGVPLAEDVIRRDFTVNALAFSINQDIGHILDFSNGLQDIGARLIRVLHPVAFYEDPSRILRALKFAVRFDFDFAEETRILMERFLFDGALIYKGGGERIRYELAAFLMAHYQDDHVIERRPNAIPKAKWLEFFMTNNVLQLANMELIRRPSSEKTKRLLDADQKLPFILKSLQEFITPDTQANVCTSILISDLPEDDLETTCHRLGLTRYQREVIEKLLRLETDQRFTQLHEFSAPSEIYQCFDNLPLETVIAAMIQETDKQRFKIILELFKTYKRKLEHIQLELDGNDLMQLGVQQGKPIGEMMKLLLQAKLSGKANDRLGEIRFVQEFLGLLPAPNNLSALPPSLTDENEE